MKYCRFPPDSVKGWLTEAEGQKLAELAIGARVIEAGTFAGRSTICMAQTALYVTTIDPHTHGVCDTYIELIHNLRGTGQGARVAVIKATLLETAAYWTDGQFDMAFLDAAHFYQDTREELKLLRRIVRPGGVICCHDHNDEWPGVPHACGEAFPGIVPDMVDALAIYRLPA